MHIIIWAIICIACLVFELLTIGDLVTIWFGLGAFFACIISAFSFSNTTIEVIVFVVVSFAALLSLRPICIKALKKDNTKTNIDALIGSTVKIIEPVKTDSMGSAKINGVVWSIVSEDDTEIESGAYCTIVKVQGNKLIVKIK